VQAKAHAAFMRNVDARGDRCDRRKALLKHFTEAELKAMAAFYTTPEGLSCMTKVGPFAAEVVPACAAKPRGFYRKAALDAARGAFP
jgi:hypothetical protein